MKNSEKMQESGKVAVDTTAVDTLPAELATAVVPQVNLNQASAEELFDSEKKLDEELIEAQIQAEGAQVASTDAAASEMIAADTNTATPSSAIGGGGASADGGVSPLVWAGGAVLAAGAIVVATDDDDDNSGSPTPVNSAPTAPNASVTATEDQPVTVTIQGTDADGDALTYTPTDPAHGTLSNGLANGQFVYTPEAGYVGTDSFTVIVSDGRTTTTSTVSITVEAGVQQPSDQFTLTNGIDVATAHVFNSLPVFSPGGNDRINSLQDEDVLTGTSATDDELNVTIGARNDASSLNITPTLDSIEIINAVFTSTAANLDLQDATGVQNVNITRINGAAVINNMDASVADLSVSDTSVNANVVLGYKNASLVGNQEVNVVLDNAPIGRLTVGSSGPATQQIEVVNLNVLSDSNVDNLNLRPDGVNTTSQTLNINAAGRFQLGTDVDQDGNGLFDFAGVNGLNGGTSASVASTTVTGAGDVILGDVGSFTGFQLNGSAHTGNLQANITSAQGDSTASFTSGSGSDFLYAGGSLSGDVATNGGNDAVQVVGSLLNTENPAGVDTAASINSGSGDDSVTVNGGLQVNTSVSTGEGSDTVTIGGAVQAALVGNTDSDVDAKIDLGGGDDNLVFGLDTSASDTAPALSGDIAGGAGNDTMTITAEDSVVATAATLSVTGIETLNLVARNAFNDGASNVNDNEGNTADFTVDLGRFGSALTAVNINNQDMINLVQDGFAANVDGDSSAVTLNKVAGEVITVESVETTRNAGNTAPIVDKLGATPTSYDVNLTFDQAANSVANDSQSLTLKGENDFDISINDTGTDQVENLTLNVLGGGDHGVDLNSDFEGNLVVAGAGTGELSIFNVEANNVDTTAHTGNVFAQITENAKHSLKTGAGNDKLDLLADTVNPADAIDMGAGTDRIIVGNTLGDYVTPNSSDDEIFEGFVGIEEIELHNNANLVMNEDAFATGVERVLVDSSSALSGIRLGNDFDRNLRIDVENGADVDVENDADVDLDIRIAAGKDGLDTKVNFLDAGINNSVSITASLVDAIDNNVEIANGGDNVDIVVAEGTLAKITLVEGNAAAQGDTNSNGVFNAGEIDNDAITLTVDDAWAKVGTTLTIDASAINDFDAPSTVANFKSGTTGGATINGVAELDASLVISGTANNDVITGGDEADTLTGGAGSDKFVYSFANANDSTSQSADVITDFQSDDIIAVDAGVLAGDFQSTHATVAGLAAGDNSLDGSNGTPLAGDSFFSTADNLFVVDVNGDGDVQDGVDLVIDVANFNAAQVQYTVTASGGGSTITTGAGDDTITGGALIDDITGGLGADTITLTVDGVADTVAYTSVADSSGASVDQVMDFLSGTDVVEVDMVGVFGQAAASNFAGNFANKAAAAAGLAGTAGDGVIDYVFDQGAENLWVDANDDGLLTSSDLQVHLDSLGALAGADVTFV